MKRIVIFFLLALAAFPLPLGAQSFSDIPYRASSTTDAYQKCKLDVYMPENVPENCPAVVWLHHGGLKGGDKTKIPEALKTCGYIVFSVNYRLLPLKDETSVTVSDCIDDAAAAVAWVFNHVSEYGGSRDRIFVSGHSAGAYLADLVVLDKHWLAAYGIDADDVAALIPFSGQAITHFAYRKTLGIDALQPTIDSFAPLYHVRGDAPPIIIISGDRELEMQGRYEESAYFWRMLKLVGHPDVHIYELQGFSHFAMRDPAVQILKDQIKRLTTE
jgi:acetyl esterase/lipase